MKVHHINCGTLCPLSARLIHGRGSLFRRGRLVCHCLLIESNDGLILVDTGLSTEDITDPVRRLGRDFVWLVGLQSNPQSTALAQIERLGYRRKDVRHIFPTHLDVDHAGGIADFPAATVHLSRLEQAAAFAPRTYGEKTRYRQLRVARETKWQLYEEAGESWFQFSGVRCPIPGLEMYLIPLLGHTRGHSGLAVKTDSQWLLHAGDAYYHHQEVHPPYRCPTGLRLFQRLNAIDNQMRIANRNRLRDVVAKHPEVAVFSAHSPEEFNFPWPSHALLGPP